VVAALKQTGEWDNTIVIFVSDNGAEGRDPATPPPGADTSFEAMGSAKSYINYGAGWAEAATAPSWRFKTFGSEGGIRTPAFVCGPGVRHGTISGVYTHAADLVPTVLDIAHIPAEPGRFAGRTVARIEGLSWTRLLRTGAPVYPANKAIGQELFGSRSLRQGDWKITDIGEHRWRLFNIARDPGETRDLSAQYPARKERLLREWEKYAKSVGVVLPDPPLQPTPPKDLE
jgi:arylsulfatase